MALQILQGLICTILLLSLSGPTEGVSTLKQCCNAGKKAGHGLVNRGYSLCNKDPDEYLQSPSKMCQAVYRVCCYGEERKKSCERGERYATFPKDVASFSCTKSSEKNTMHGSTFLQCCECCGMGRLAASKNATCQPAISLNKTCDDIYQRCCKKAKALLTSAPKKCRDIECDQLCKEYPSGARCKCRDGYKLMNDSKTCKDIDECALGTHRCIMKTHNCSNLEGTYQCIFKQQVITLKCPKGYIPTGTYCRGNQIGSDVTKEVFK